MKNLMQILLFAVASIAFVACGGDAKKDETKKECCHGKDKKECTPADSVKCAENAAKEGKTCEPECKKKCCAEKEEATATDSTATTTEETSTEEPAVEEAHDHSHEGHDHGHDH